MQRLGKYRRVPSKRIKPIWGGFQQIWPLANLTAVMRLLEWCAAIGVTSDILAGAVMVVRWRCDGCPLARDFIGVVGMANRSFWLRH